MKFRAVLTVFLLLMTALLLLAPAQAQTTTGLRGKVVDPSGAVIPQATVTISGQGQKLTATSNKDGDYEFKNLAPGTYNILATAKGFANFQTQLQVTAGKMSSLEVSLEIEVEKAVVEVADQSTTLDVSSSNNASSIVIKGKDLDALSDDPDELQSDLEALAGPSAGPNGGQIYIDGFSNGQLPPKSSIREIRVNQNPFSAQYDRLGFGRVEVFTKPGKDQYHGQFMTNVSTSALNSRSPFLVGSEPSYTTEMFSGNFSGPVNSKSSFFLNFDRRNINDNVITNATILDPNNNITSKNLATPQPHRRSNFSPRLDYQLTQNNTFTARYQYWTDSETNNGVGTYSLPTYGFNQSSTSHNLQISDTQIIGPTVVNETRFQYTHDDSNSKAITFAPAVSVPAAFTDGGWSGGINANQSGRYEFQNYTSMVRKNHFIRFGGRVRASRNSVDSTGGYNGTFLFTNINTYQATMQMLASGMNMAQIVAAGYGPSQFSITSGNPVSSVSQVDAGLYLEDDWKLRPNMTLSYGLRFESQTNISDHADLAPRIGFAWGLGRVKNGPAKTILRAGYGIFYDRFSEGLVRQANTLNGINQQQYLVTSPEFYLTDVPAVDSTTRAAWINSLAGVTTATPNIYQIAPNLRAPYVMQVATTIERQLTKTATLAVSYINSRGLHQFVLADINAPYPGTNIRPFPTAGQIYQYTSAGMFKQNQLIVNTNVRIGKNLSINSFYMLNYANTDTGGASSLATNPYNIADDWGRSGYGVRNRFFLMGNISLPKGFRLNPFIMASSGRPFNIVTGYDANADGSYSNDRPAFATDTSLPDCTTVSTPNCNYYTKWGAFNTQGLPGAKVIPYNYGVASGMFTTNLRISKTFGLGHKLETAARGGDQGGAPQAGPRGPMGGGGGHDHGPGRGGPGGMMGGGGSSGQRYSLTFSASVRNLFNTVNVGLPVNYLSAGTAFGKSNDLLTFGGPTSSSNRRVDMQVMFNF